MENKGTMQYFQEFAFYRSVETLNAMLTDRGDNPITSSQGRGLHDKFLKELELPDMSHPISQDDFVNTCNKVFKDFCGEEIPDRYGEYVKFFRSYTGIGSNTKEAVLPISPYDPKFSQFGSMLKAGAELRFIPDEALIAQYEGSPLSLRENRDRRFFSTPLLRETEFGFTKAGMLATQDDANGLTRLMRFMSPKEFEAASDWLSKLPPGEGMSKKGVDRAVAIFEYLQEEGIPYSVKADGNIGQLTAKLEGFGISVRVADTRENEHFVGRVYDGNSLIYYSTNHRDGKKFAAYENPTPSECVDLLKFRLGQPVYRPGHEGEENYRVGLAATYNVERYDPKLKQRAIFKTNASYIAGESFSAAVKRYTENGVPTDDGAVVSIYMKGAGKQPIYFGRDSDAETFLDNAIESAKRNLIDRLEIDKLFSFAEEHASDPDAVPDFNPDPELSKVQAECFSLIRGEIPNLIKPGAEFDSYYEKLMNAEELSDQELKAVQSMRYTGDAKEQITQFVADFAEEMIGSRKINRKDGKRFDLVNTARYMDTNFSVFKNNEDLIAAVERAHIAGEELRGDTFYHDMVRDKLIEFDDISAVPMLEHPNPMMRRFGEVIRETIETSGGHIMLPEDLLVDENGVVSYYAYRKIGMNPDSEEATLNGTVKGKIGQIFVPDERGVIETKFASSKNYYSVPGYEAYVLPQKFGENKSLEERTRLRGFEQLMSDQLRYTVRRDFVTSRGDTGSKTSVSSVYRRLYDTRHPLDYFERGKEDKMPEDWQKAIIETEARRVKYDKAFQQGSTLNAVYFVKNGMADLRNDSFMTPLNLSGGRDMSILTPEGDGYFDPTLTGGGTNQGTVRFLTEGAVVNPDGSITKSDVTDRSPLMKHPDMRFSDFDPFDRQQMVSSNIFQASSITEPVGVAMMTCGGWNMDDGVVVSKEFAEKHMVRGAGDELRPMVVGDKISDFHGNKGTIALIVDPDMDPEEAKKEKIHRVVDVFKNNPNLSVVMAPFSAVSRFNGGSARELMQNTSDLKLADGVVPGGIGEVKFIVTHMSVDVKTKVYDDDAVDLGKGRKASSQLAWALNAYDANAVMREMYGSNKKATVALREYLMVLGYDMDGKGKFLTEYMPQAGEERTHFTLPEKSMYKTNAKGVSVLDTKTASSDFAGKISNSGGFLELSFSLKFPDGRELKKDEASGKYLLPVMSAYLRSGQEFADGTLSVHDYTGHYVNLYVQALKYQQATEKLLDGSLSDKDREKYKKALADTERQAQGEFTAITSDVIERQFTGKHNIMRDGLMANRLSHSATAVITADPRLGLDEVGIGPNISSVLGVKDGDMVVTWRDPMLRKEGLVAATCKMDESVHGMRINPVSDKRFDGDFDGDTMALWRPSMKESRAEAMEKFGYAATLLDSGSINEKTSGHGLAFNLGLDMKVAAHRDPAVKTMLEKLETGISKYELEASEGKHSPEELKDIREKTLKALSTCVTKALEENVGTAVIRFDSMAEHIKSLKEACIDTGAKGSLGKLRHYMTALGVTDGKENGDIDFAAIQDTGKTGFTRESAIQTETATSVKSFGLGVGGSYSQRGMLALRNLAPESVLEMTYPPTQSLAQAKHDAVEAARKYSVLMSVAKHAWRGEAIAIGKDGEYRIAKDSETNKPYKLTKEAWVEQMCEFYSNPTGLNVPVHRKHFEVLADKMADSRGIVRGVDELAKDAAAMDRLAYTGNFAVLQELVKKGASVFEGKYNQQFAPTAVQKNLEAENGTERSMIKKDTQAGFKKSRQIDEKKKAFSKAISHEIQYRAKNVPKNEVETGHGFEL